MDSKMQRIVVQWVQRCFGLDASRDVHERGLRVVEEAIELGQASGVPQDQVHGLVKHVYSQPKGNPGQELGGTLICCVAYAHAIERQADLVFLEELCRILAKNPEHFRERWQKKINAGLSGEGYTNDKD